MAGVVAQNTATPVQTGDDVDEAVTIEFFPIAASEMSLLESIMMPFRIKSPITHDAEKGVASVVLTKKIAVEMVSGGILAGYKCRIGDPEIQAIYEAKTNEEDAPIVSETVLTKPEGSSELRLRKPAEDVQTRQTVETRNTGWKANLKERVPLSPDDPFFIVTDVNIMAPLFLAYCIFLVFWTAIF